MLEKEQKISEFLKTKKIIRKKKFNFFWRNKNYPKNFSTKNMERLELKIQKNFL